MPDEPQHPMEPRLRAWAQSRRQQAGPGFELHPADRARLHEEIGRVQDSAVGSSTPAIPLWRALLPRLTLIGALTALLLLAIVQWMPRQGEGESASEFAQLSKEETTVAPAESALSESPVTSRQLDPEPSLRVEMRPDSLPLPLAPARNPAEIGETTRPEPAPSPAAALSESKLGLTAPSAETESAPPRAMPSDEPSRQLIVDRYGLAPASQPEAAPPETQPDWTAFFERRQVARRNLNAPSDVALQSFKVEQRGPHLWVLDADGSVYRGSVRAGQSAAGLPVAQKSFTGGVIPTNGLSFQVTGTNQTSQRALFFQGLILTGATDRLQGNALLDGRDRIVVEARERP